MGKQVKTVKKSKHNRDTLVWSRSYDKEGNAHDITYPKNTLWDWSRTHDAVSMEDGTCKLMPRKQRPLHEPFDRLTDNWSDNLLGFAEHNGAKIDRELIGPGLFRYTVYYEMLGKSKDSKDREIILTVESGKNLNFRSPKKRRKRK